MDDPKHQSCIFFTLYKMGGGSNLKKKVTDLGATTSTRSEQICKVVYDLFPSFTIIAEVEEGFLTLFKSIYDEKLIRNIWMKIKI